MSQSEPITTDTVTLVVARHEGRIALLDSEGRFVSRWLDPADLMPTDSPALPSVAVVLNWKRWAETAASGVEVSHRRHQASAGNPWMAKCASWATSCRMRGKDIVGRPKGKTTGVRRIVRPDWETAVNLLWHQINNRHRRFVQGPWGTWCRTVANNLNKRKGAKYGRD